MIYLEEMNRNKNIDYSLNYTQNGLHKKLSADKTKSVVLKETTNIVEKSALAMDQVVRKVRRFTEKIVPKDTEDTARIRSNIAINSLKKLKDATNSNADLQLTLNTTGSKDDKTSIENENTEVGRMSNEITISDQYDSRKDKSTYLLEQGDITYNSLSNAINNAQVSSAIGNQNFIVINQVEAPLTQGDFSLTNEQISTNSGLVNTDILALNEMQDNKLITLYNKPMHAKTGSSGTNEEDGFDAGVGTDNGFKYNDSNGPIGSLPVADGTVFLFVLSALFITLKSFKLSIKA
jgi:hypothetical protein